jgi:hypothetical protein
VAVRRANGARYIRSNTLGVTHGALARACHAAYERGSLGRAWNLLRRPGGRLRRFVNRGDVNRKMPFPHLRSSEWRLEDAADWPSARRCIWRVWTPAALWVASGSRSPRQLGDVPSRKARRTTTRRLGRARDAARWSGRQSAPQSGLAAPGEIVSVQRWQNRGVRFRG